MNTDTIYKTHTSSPDATLALGERIAKVLPDPAVIELTSDLGGGKTTLTRGLARGLGYDGVVASPTFTLSQIHQLPDGRELHHYDFYRLPYGDIVAEELAESIAAQKTVTVIEWANTAEDKLPADRLKIEIMATGDDARDITVSATGPVHQKIVQGLRS